MMKLNRLICDFDDEQMDKALADGWVVDARDAATHCCWVTHIAARQILNGNG
jgi:hypothetical protein